MARPKTIVAEEPTKTESQSPYDLMKANGIPVTMAQFQSAVNNGENIPENAFNAKSGAPGRRVEMWMCPPILLCYHNKTYFWTPLVNVVHAR